MSLIFDFMKGLMFGLIIGSGAITVSYYLLVKKFSNKDKNHVD